ncbi:MAG: 1-(5-phosphoribosyl)-5-[(5-phosphoribosylamino)methylideneamino]imidazole-4-carboxamide isomerase [Omnitrophica bacterium RBG_13_46_9]|nr:MAG: 1-(5-phosphoribosyl)-5-[(5-phosphoribosylamino)methylideneamino]imidazole-4-carboxamide isomerase [Omnitrophica bacterium RBG_13_46_9]
MNIIPAIDIMDKKVVRLEQGEFDKEKVYSENPILVAQKWKKLGAELIHIVDLDGARLGKPVNMDVVREVARNVEIDIELGGGLRSEEDIENAFKTGVRFVVIGTSAVEDLPFCKFLAEKYKDRVIFAVDVKKGKIAVRGWKVDSGVEVAEYLNRLEGIGAKKIIYTDISRDGMMAGPNLERLKAILKSTSSEVTASGGITNLEDVKVLKELEKDGLCGIIIGKALYEGKLDLREALSIK